MKEISPCKDCSERHPICHGSCEKYQEWKNRDQAQKKHLQENKNRWAIPMTSAREKAYANYQPDHRKYSQGGGYE